MPNLAAEKENDISASLSLKFLCKSILDSSKDAVIEPNKQQLQRYVRVDAEKSKQKEKENEKATSYQGIEPWQPQRDRREVQRGAPVSGAGWEIPSVNCPSIKSIVLNLLSE